MTINKELVSIHKFDKKNSEPLSIAKIKGLEFRERKKIFSLSNTHLFLEVLIVSQARKKATFQKEKI